MLEFALQRSDYELAVCSPHTKDEICLMVSHNSTGHYRTIGDLNKMYHLGKRTSRFFIVVAAEGTPTSCTILKLN